MMVSRFATSGVKSLDGFFPDYQICNRVKGERLTEGEVKAVLGLGRPEPHGVDCVVLVAWDGAVVRHRKHNLQDTEI